MAKPIPPNLEGGVTLNYRSYYDAESGDVTIEGAAGDVASGVAPASGATANMAVHGGNVATMSAVSNAISGAVEDLSGDGEDGAATTFVTTGGDQTISGTKTFTPSQTFSGGAEFAPNVTLGGGGTIAGATWSNGTFHLGTDTAGWAIDPNEIYNSGQAVIGTLEGTLTLSPKTKISTQKPIESGSTITSGAITINANGDALNLRNTAGSGSIRATFSSHVATNDQQIGYIEYCHVDTASYGSGESFILGGNQSNITVLADGKLMFRDGIYKKPASGTGAGTRKDANWDTAYGWGDHAAVGYLTSAPPDYGDWNGAGFITEASANAKYVRVDTNTDVSAHIEMQDDKQVRFGTDADVRQYFNGTDFYCRSYSHGARLLFQGERTSDGSNRALLYLDPDGEAGIYHSGAKKGYTYSSGWRVTGNLLATSDVYAYYSDVRLKDVVGTIDNPVDKVKSIETFFYTHNDTARELGYEGAERQIGVSAQSVKEVLPEVIHRAPIDEDGEGGSVTGEDYMTVDYPRLVPLLIESIKQLSEEIDELKEKLNAL